VSIFLAAFPISNIREASLKKSQLTQDFVENKQKAKNNKQNSKI
jgi:hypothetical protein